MEQVEVIFLDDDKTTVLDRQFVNIGEKVKYNGKIPSKEPINGVNYTFIGWIGEEKMEAVLEKTIFIAKYSAETATSTKEENALLEASLQNAENTNLNATIEAGQKANAQLKALEKDPRTAEQIVNEVLENGKTEIGQDINKDNKITSSELKKQNIRFVRLDFTNKLILYDKTKDFNLNNIEFIDLSTLRESVNNGNIGSFGYFDVYVKLNDGIIKKITGCVTFETDKELMELIK